MRYIEVPFDNLEGGVDAITAAEERNSSWAETNSLRLNARPRQFSSDLNTQSNKLRP